MAGASASVQTTVEANFQRTDQTLSERHLRIEAVVEEMRRITAEVRTTYLELRAHRVNLSPDRSQR
jgi:hypothetical protein